MGEKAEKGYVEKDALKVLTQASQVVLVHFSAK